MSTARLSPDIKSGASFSEDRNYRYVLWRIWDESLPLVMFIGLNPSTANETEPDPTIRCVIKFAKEWGYGGVYMANLFAIVSSKPEVLLTCEDAVGDNDYHLSEISDKCKDVVFAWGAFKQAKDRVNIVSYMFPNALCIGQKNGNPFHPLWAGVYAKDKSQFTKPIKYNQCQQH